MTKEDLQIEINLNHTAKEILDKLDDLALDKDTRNKIELLAETVMEVTADKIMNHTGNTAE
jgi:hypothetical protein